MTFWAEQLREAVEAHDTYVFLFVIGLLVGYSGTQMLLDRIRARRRSRGGRP